MSRASAPAPGSTQSRVRTLACWLPHFLISNILCSAGSTIIAALISRRIAWSVRVAQHQLPAISLLTFQVFHRFHCAFSVDEICVCKTSWLASTSVNGNADVNHISDTLEQVVEVAIGHLERHIANEESLGGRIKRLRRKASSTLSIRQALRLVCGILHSKAATFEELLIERFDGFRSLFGGFKVNVAKSIQAYQKVSRTAISRIGSESLRFSPFT